MGGREGWDVRGFACGRATSRSRLRMATDCDCFSLWMDVWDVGFTPSVLTILFSSQTRATYTGLS